MRIETRDLLSNPDIIEVLVEKDQWVTSYCYLKHPDDNEWDAIEKVLESQRRDDDTRPSTWSIGRWRRVWRFLLRSIS